MRILYLHQYFSTPKSNALTVTGTRSYEFARRFAAAGHEVHMITSDIISGVENTDWKVEVIEGIIVHSTPVAYSNKMGFIARLRAFGAFAWRARSYASKISADVVFATSTPLTIAIPAFAVVKRQKIPLVFEVRDLWPEAPRQMGHLKNPILYWLAKRLELAAYQASSYVVALSPGMKKGVVEAGVPENRVAMIPNSCDLNLFHPAVDGTDARQRLGLGDRLAFLYFGTMGPANGLDFVLDAASELKKRGEKNIVLVLHGDGKMRSHLERRQQEEGLDNVVFSKPLPDKSQVSMIVAAADIGMTIYKNLPVLYTCSPNKMFDTLAAGKPVLTNMPGWLSDIVESNKCGISVRPDDPVDFADKVQKLSRDRGLIELMRVNARRLAETEFSRDVLADQLLKLLVKAASEKRQ